MNIIKALAPLIVFLISATITMAGWISISEGGGGISLYLGGAAVFVGPVLLLLGDAVVLDR